MNSLPKTVTRQRRGCFSVPESSTLTTRLPSHPYRQIYCSGKCASLMWKRHTCRLERDRSGTVMTADENENERTTEKECSEKVTSMTKNDWYGAD